MDQTTLNWIAAAAMGTIGWFARMLWERQEAHTKDLAEFRVLVAGNYVTSAALSAVLTGLRDDLRYIRERLDETPQRRHGDRS